MTRKSGFTLIEVLIATAILVVALGGILSLVSHCYTLIETSRNGSKALNIAQRRFEEIRNMDFVDIIDPAKLNPSFVIADPDGLNFTGTVSIQQLDSHLDRVTIDIGWNQGARQITHSYTTAIAERTE